MGQRLADVGYGFVRTVAAAYPERFAAAASFHGGSLATDEPDSPHRNFDKIKARVKAALDAAQVEYRAEIWPGALHGWTMADLPVYNREAAERHFEELRNLFGAVLND
jgi:carboxymethylenebutenolidase